jgi:hypothetical protein
MPTSYKVLGQLEPQSTSGTLYTVPADTQAVVSTINVVNVGSTNSEISIAIRPGGASIEDKHYIIRQITLNPKVTFTYTAGLTLGATDVITVVSTNNDCAFSAFGSEVA